MEVTQYLAATGRVQKIQQFLLFAPRQSYKYFDFHAK